jgi:oxygen-dependent protoporphyrinogen oxidase
MAATFPKLVEMERQHGSLLSAMLKSRKTRERTRRGHTSSFLGGMETLPRRLASRCAIVFNSQRIVVNSRLNVQWTVGESQPKAVVITTPSFRANTILEEVVPRAAQLLNQIKYAPMVIATVCLTESAFPASLKGFGFLVPRSEKLHLLGTLFSSALFPARAPQGHHLLTAFLGGALEPEVFGWPDERIWDVVQNELKIVLKTSGRPEPLRIVRRAQAIPQYQIGHERLIATLKDEIRATPGLFLAGNYMEGVSVASCMEIGERAAHDVAAFVRQS